MKKTTYLFDFDGTLVDSMPSWMRKVLNILDKSGVSYPDDIIKIITPLGDLGTAKYFRDVLGVEMTLDEMFVMMDEYALPKYRDEIILKEGVFDYLTALRQKGASLNVLTASPHKMLDPCLKRNGIYDLFDNVWSSDDFGLTKSNPEIYREVARRLGKDEGEIAFFDDNIGAVRTASEAGLFTVAVFDESATDFTDEIKTVADLYVESFEHFSADAI